jgi:hypothetical protein
MKSAAQASQTHCRNGHPLSGNNLQKVSTRPKKRICKTCRADSSRTFSEKKRSGVEISSRWKHGHSRDGFQSHEYKTWLSVIARCERPSRKDYSSYGAIGIKICRQWRNSFEQFVKDVGASPSASHTLDRFPNGSGDYEPGNVRWATREEQAQNRKDNVLLTLNNKTQCLAQWAKELRMNEDTIRSRLKRGWSVVRALTSPHRGNHKEN